MAICILHGLKADGMDQRRVFDDGSGEIVLVSVIACEACRAEAPETEGLRELETRDKGPAKKRYVSGNRVPCPVRHGKRPQRFRLKRRHYRGRTGGEIPISTSRSEP